MSNRKRNIFRSALTVGLKLAWVCLLLLCGLGVRSTSVNAQDVQPSFKNLQVLKDIAPDQLLPAMQFMSAS